MSPRICTYKNPSPVSPTSPALPAMDALLRRTDAFCLHSFRPMLSRVKVIVRGACGGLQDLETGRVYREAAAMPAPMHRGDAVKTREAEAEYAFEVPVAPGRSMYMKLLP